MTGWPVRVREGAPIGVGLRAFADQVSFVHTAANLYGSALAAATPAALDPAVSFAIGRTLATRGWFAGLIQLDGDGDPLIVPADLWINRGVWTGTTRPLDGEIGVPVAAPDAAVINVRYPDGLAPVSRVHPLGDLAAALDGAMRDEAEVPVLRLIGLALNAAFTTAEQRTAITAGLQKLGVDDSRLATVASEVEQARVGRLGPEPDRAAVELRDQIRHDVAAAYGVQGLLAEGASTEIHGFWRVATVRTFEPLALMVEAELARKLDTPARFDRSKWIAAPVSEVARERAQRGAAVQRLVAAGVEVERALGIAGLDE